MLNKSEPQVSFKKLRQLLLRFIRFGAQPENIVIIKQSIFSLSLLAKMYPAELIEFIIKGEILQRLIELFKQFEEMAFISFLLKIVKAILKDLKDGIFKQLILPMI
jgi:hypothetical protein